MALDTEEFDKYYAEDWCEWYEQLQLENETKTENNNIDDDLDECELINDLIGEGFYI